MLLEAGFNELRLKDISKWKIEKGGRYFLDVYDSSLIAFTVGEKFNEESMIRIAASHTDQPCLYIKPNPEMVSGVYGKVNVEIYGGPILNTWLDRPLSVAGKIALKSSEVFKPEIRIVDIKKPIFTIPNLAIHMNRDVNKGIELNKQIDMAPICTIIEEEINKDDFFIKYLANELNVNKGDILDYELFIYNAEEGCVLGINEELISSPRLDNITSVTACTKAIIDSKNSDGLNIIVNYDNEEIGSRTKQGADSILLSNVIEQIYEALGYNRKVMMNAVINGFMLSVDVAHAIHPNKPEKSDVTNINPMNKGFVIKRASSQSYATDCESIAIVEQICKANDIPYQKFSTRSDSTTGSTLGTIANKYIPMRTVDIGVPILAMHSARETMGIKDQYYLEKFIKAYFE